MENKLTDVLAKKAEGFGLKKEEFERFATHLKREPSLEEMAVCGALWSEHCSYKSSRVHLVRFHTKEPWVWQGPGENAGIIGITEDWGIAFKMESHNHPSYIEPYQGAATGVGGILRDVFCMGAWPIANMNCLRYGEGERHSSLLKNSVRGIGDYGNSVGVPTVSGDTSFHFGYNKNILINAFNAGIIHKNEIFRGVLESDETVQEKSKDPRIKALENTAPGSEVTLETRALLFPENANVLLYFGSATGRDGVHGATMSSDEFSATGESLKPTVQVGDPFAEKVLLQATRALIAESLVIGLQDMGAAGLTSSSVEMAGRSGSGVAIDLSRIPLRAANMHAYEILLSESQERMLAAVEPNKVDAVMLRLQKFGLSAGIVGSVNRTGRFVCLHNNKICTNVDVGVLVDDTPRYEWPLEDRSSYLEQNAVLKNRAELHPTPAKAGSKPVIALQGASPAAHAEILKGISLSSFVESYSEVLVALLEHPSFTSRAPLYSHYDSTVQGNTVGAPGALQNTAAGVVRLPRAAQPTGSKGQWGAAFSAGCEERWVEHDPLHGSQLTALKVARKIIATGGIPLGMTDCLNFGSPSQPRVMRQFSDSVDGISRVAKEMKIPIVSGNVSLNNQTDGKAIPPTPMLGMVGRIENLSKVPLKSLPVRYFEHPDAKELTLVRVGFPNSFEHSKYGCSLSAWILGAESVSPLPDVDLELEKKLWQFVRSTVSELQPRLCFPIGQGGVLLSILRSAYEGSGCFVPAEQIFQSSMQRLLAEGNMGFVFGFASKQSIESFLHLVKTAGLEGEILGQLAQSETKALLKTDRLRKAFAEGLLPYFRGL
jgi:phosphoribosylformylglycinamidine (FGAM) synthase-like enzyme